MAIAQILLVTVISSPVICLSEPLPSSVDTSESNIANWMALQPKFFSTAPYSRHVNTAEKSDLVNPIDHIKSNLGSMNARAVYTISKHLSEDPTWKMIHHMNLNRRSLSRFTGATNEKRNTLQRLAMNGARGFGRK